MSPHAYHAATKNNVFIDPMKRAFGMDDGSSKLRHCIAWLWVPIY